MYLVEYNEKFPFRPKTKYLDLRQREWHELVKSKEVFLITIPMSTGVLACDKSHLNTREMLIFCCF